MNAKWKKIVNSNRGTIPRFFVTNAESFDKTYILNRLAFVVIFRVRIRVKDRV